ncbi:MAG TPA: ATP-binding protein, partial [Acetobacteraceae bacterium]|nr:ATP-binding protein [Acetobacteraceae bacterium]
RLWPTVLVGLGILLILAAGALLRPAASPPVAAGLGGLVLVAAGGVLLLGRVGRAETAAAEQRRRATLLADASARLARLRDPTAIARLGEALLRDLLGQDCVAGVALDDAELPPLPAAGDQRRLPLRGPAGDLLGRICVARPSGRRFAAGEAELLAELARAIAGTLDVARRVAAAAQAHGAADLVLESISDGLLLLDPDWRVRYANAAALRHLRCSMAELTGITLWQRFPGLAGGDIAGRMQEAVKQRRESDFTAFFPSLGAWFEVHCHPSASGLVVCFRNVTALREAGDRQVQSQRLEALGQLTGGIAHDMNNLLTVVLGNFEMLALSAEERGDAGRPDLELAESGLRAGGNARQLMRRLLAFSRRQQLSPQRVDIAALLAEMQPLLRRSVGENVTLRIAAPEGLWPAMADPMELESALINLVLNARDAMPGGGTLTIEAGNVAIDQVYAVIAGIERTGDYVLITVADDGSGMAREVMERAFDPFFTTKAPGKGTGLGLSMVYGFARQSAGHVTIDSEPGAGTVVRLYLPRSTAERPPPGPAEEVQGGCETILLVENEDLVRNHAASVLTGLGYRVLAAPDGQEALRLLDPSAPPDLLLSDLVLPGDLSAQQVAEAAARRAPALRLLFITVHPGGMRRDGAPPGPPAAVIRKPFTRRELAAGVRRQLAVTPRSAAAPPPLATEPETG